jgi:hypothetical protein
MPAKHSKIRNGNVEWGHWLDVGHIADALRIWLSIQCERAFSNGLPAALASERWTVKILPAPSSATAAWRASWLVIGVPGPHRLARGLRRGTPGRSEKLGASVKRASTRVKVPSVQLDGSAPQTVPTASPRGGVGAARP